MKKVTILRLRLVGLGLAVLMALLTFNLTAFAQATTPQPQPTGRPLSGSNPVVLEPTDIPIEWSLFWVFMFFFVLCIGLLFANWLVRRGTFNEPERRI